MRIDHARFIMCLILFTSASFISHARADLVGLDLNSIAYEINPSNAELTRIGPVHLPDDPSNGGAGGLALGLDGYLYTFNPGSASNLYRIDPGTLQATDIGPLGLPFTFEGALAFSPGGTLYAANGNNAGADQLLTLNTTTGAATIVGTLTVGSHDINGMIWRSDNTLVGIDRVTNSLVDINPQTAALSIIAPLTPTLGGVGDLTTYNGVSYFTTSGPLGDFPGSNELWTVNLFTGADSLVGGFSSQIMDAGISGLASDPAVPEPGAGGVLIVAAALAAHGRRRKSGKLAVGAE